VLFTALLFVNRVLWVFSFEYDLGGIEEYFVYLILQVGNGHLYSDPEAYPYLITQYPPLYLYITSLGARILELFNDDLIHSTYITGRALNLFFNIVTCLIVYRFLQALTTNRKYSMIMSMVVFTLFAAHNIAVRPDSLKILLVVSMYYYLWKYLTKGQLISYVVLITLSVLSILTKQDALIHVVAIGLVLILKQGILRSFGYGMITGGIAGLLILICCDFNWILVHKNLVAGISQGISIPWAKSVIVWNILIFVAQLLLLSVVFVQVSFFKKRERWLGLILLYMYAVIQLSVLKWGSNFNYFLEFQILLVVLFAYWMSERRYQYLKYVFALSVIGIFTNNLLKHSIKPFNAKGQIEMQKLYSADRQVADELKSKYLTGNDKMFISFSLKFTLFLYKRTVLGTTINEYPEAFIPDIESFVGSLPEKTYQYNLPCSDEQLDKILFVAESDNMDIQKQKLLQAFRTNPSLYLISESVYDDMHIFSLKCDNTNN